MVLKRRSLKRCANVVRSLSGVVLSAETLENVAAARSRADPVSTQQRRVGGGLILYAHRQWDSSYGAIIIS